ncbi:MAG: hypothetical protein Q8R28_16335 [Dehalococcoidia bacterium]|nr:hypothetical protein [Dehalococcoidia bacterium]
MLTWQGIEDAFRREPQIAPGEMAQQLRVTTRELMIMCRDAGGYLAVRAMALTAASREEGIHEMTTMKPEAREALRQKILPLLATQPSLGIEGLAERLGYTAGTMTAYLRQLGGLQVVRKQAAEAREATDAGVPVTARDAAVSRTVPQQEAEPGLPATPDNEWEMILPAVAGGGIRKHTVLRVSKDALELNRAATQLLHEVSRSGAGTTVRLSLFWHPSGKLAIKPDDQGAFAIKLPNRAQGVRIGGAGTLAEFTKRGLRQGYYAISEQVGRLIADVTKPLQVGGGEKQGVK